MHIQHFLALSDCFTDDSDDSVHLVTKHMKDGNLFDFLKNSTSTVAEREVKMIASTLVETLLGMHLCEIYHGNLVLQSVFLKLSKKSSGFSVKLGGFWNARNLRSVDDS